MQDMVITFYYQMKKETEILSIRVNIYFCFKRITDSRVENRYQWRRREQGNP